MNVALILLAAGDSRRFQGNKLLHKLHGKHMYRYLVDEISDQAETLFERKIVVTQQAVIKEDLAALGYRVVWNDSSHLGISHSLRLALELLDRWEGECDNRAALCFAVCDQPYLKGDTLAQFIEQWKLSGKGLGCLGAGERLGNPAIFSEHYIPELYALEGDRGGKQIIRRHMEDLFVYQVPVEELQDIDTR